MSPHEDFSFHCYVTQPECQEYLEWRNPAEILSILCSWRPLTRTDKTRPNQLWFASVLEVAKTGNRRDQVGPERSSPMNIPWVYETIFGPFLVIAKLCYHPHIHSIYKSAHPHEISDTWTLLRTPLRTPGRVQDSRFVILKIQNSRFGRDVSYWYQCHHSYSYIVINT